MCQTKQAVATLGRKYLPYVAKIGSLWAMPELTSVWNAYGYHAKTYQQEDGCYTTVIYTTDYDTEDEALAFLEQLRGLLGSNRG